MDFVDKIGDYTSLLVGIIIVVGKESFDTIFMKDCHTHTLEHVCVAYFGR